MSKLSAHFWNSDESLSARFSRTKYSNIFVSGVGFDWCAWARIHCLSNIQVPISAVQKKLILMRNIRCDCYLVISSVLTALGVPGGTAAKTFDDAYLDDVSRSKRDARTKSVIFRCCISNFLLLESGDTFGIERVNLNVSQQPSGGPYSVYINYSRFFELIAKWIKSTLEQLFKQHWRTDTLNVSNERKT